MQYLLDTNIFIEAYKRYYHNNIVPSFWKYLKDDHDIFTIKAVKEEIRKGSDPMFELVKDIQELKS